MDAALVDTDILSEVLKRKDLRVLAKVQQYLVQHQRLAISAISMYEIVRGLRATNATQQLTSFIKTVNASDVFPISTSVLTRAARLWADARTADHPHDDADLIIAATALESQRALITGNASHFSWIPGLALDDWRKP